jgi:hypothetical protein
MSQLTSFLSRPGVQSSEFKVLVALTAWLGLNADQHWLSLLQGLVVALPGITYALSRGLAKSEPRGPGAASR